MPRLPSPRRDVLLNLALAGATVVWLAVHTWPDTPAGEEAARCREADFVLREAGQCLLYPTTRWQRLDDMAGVRLQTCREQLTALADLGFHRDEALSAAQYRADKDAGVSQYWRAVHGREFCSEVERRALPGPEWRRSTASVPASAIKTD